MNSSAHSSSRQITAEAAAWFIEFRTEGPTSHQRARFDQWLRASPLHIQAYLEIAAGWTELPASDPDGRIEVERMIAAARASPELPVSLPSSRIGSTAARRPARNLKPRTAVAASIVMAALATAIAVALRGASSYSTGIGEQRTIRLADSSLVELNARSRIAVRLTDKQREIRLLEGQALFHVAKDPLRPFVVQAGGTQIRAVGTQFDVYRKQGGTIVTVIEGRVAVTAGGHEGAGAEGGSRLPDRVLTTGKSPGVSDRMLLSAGEQAIIGPLARVRSGDADIAAVTAWTRKRLVFEDTPLSDVAEEFNRYSSKPLVIDDPELGRVGISGLYSSTDPAALIAFLKLQPTMRVIESRAEIRIARREHN